MTDDNSDFQVVAKFLPELNHAAALLSSIDEELGKKFIDDVMKEKAFKSFDQIKNALIAEIAISKFSDDNDLKNLGISLLLSGQKDKANELETLIRIFSATISSKEIKDRFLKHYEKIHDDVKRPSVENIISENKQQAILENYKDAHTKSSNHPSHSEDVKKSHEKKEKPVLGIFLQKKKLDMKNTTELFNSINYKNKADAVLNSPAVTKIISIALSLKTSPLDNRLVLGGSISLGLIMIWFASVTFGNLPTSTNSSSFFGSSKFSGSEQNVYFHECSGGNYQNGAEYIGKTIYCLTKSEEKSICESRDLGITTRTLRVLGSYVEVKGQDPNRFLTRLIENNAYNWNKEWQGSFCKIILIVNGMVDGNTVNRTIIGRVDHYHFVDSKMLVTLASGMN